MSDVDVNPSEPLPPAAPAPPAEAPARKCENCGAVLLGEHCHACGQPIKGLVRHFSSVMGDFFDTVFNIDSRVLRTIGPLFTRPGFLSVEYFAGRRVRYVTPVRLFFFLSLLAFFVIQSSINIDDGGGDGVKVGASRGDSIDNATTPEELRRVTALALAELDKARKEVANVPGASAGLTAARVQIERKSRAREVQLQSVIDAKAEGKPVPSAPALSKGNFNVPINGKDWDPVTNPVAFAWLPNVANASLNRRLLHAREVMQSSDSGKPMVEALFNVLPQTLFVLMPLFAVMLKIAYWFKRRLYMEHLIVALHSHAFIAFALTILLLLSWLQEWLAPGDGFAHGAFTWAIVLTGLWIPLYLLLMQKRVYAQGWLMTLVKFSVLGFCYSVLVGFAAVGAFFIGLLTM